MEVEPYLSTGLGRRCIEACKGRSISCEIHHILHTLLKFDLGCIRCFVLNNSNLCPNLRGQALSVAKGTTGHFRMFELSI